MSQLTTQLSLNLRSDFESAFGLSVPSADVADVLQFQYDLVYSSDPTISEYTDGATNVINAALGLDYPETASASIALVGSIVEEILGSGRLQAGLKSSAVHTQETDAQNPLVTKTYVNACISLITDCSAKQWGTKDDFYVAYYCLAVWPVDSTELARFVDHTAQPNGV